VDEVKKTREEAVSGIPDDSHQDAMLNDPEVQAMLKLLLAKMGKGGDGNQKRRF